ncbi:MAG: DoxX family protein [Thermomicrobiales bacterium]|nr:DoxX family protein [Thermomicrobiales bacterium]
MKKAVRRKQVDDQTHPGAADVGHLALRVVVGGLLAGHGAQKLFGLFGGAGLNGTSAWLAGLGYAPAKPWAVMAGVSEFGGGMLTALGLLHPLGPIATLGSMTIATLDGHQGRPIWATDGGAELPVTNMAVALASATAGPGALSLDCAIGIRVPKSLVALTAAGVLTGVLIAESRPRPIIRHEGETQRPVPAPDLRPAS